MARRAKLKVFRTPIGFHRAYVAALSQKAAFAAWGADVNLFARGSAEQVTDDELAREPLAKPGEVVRRLRGSTEEHLGALPPDPPRRRKPGGPKGAATKKAISPGRPTSTPAKSTPVPRPSRQALDAAERNLEDVVERQRREDDDIRERERRLRIERKALADSHFR